MICFLTSFLSIIGSGHAWISVQPRTNVWVTLANKTGQDSICLAAANAGNPFMTCLVGTPIGGKEWEYVCNSSTIRHACRDIANDVNDFEY